MEVKEGFRDFQKVVLAKEKHLEKDGLDDVVSNPLEVRFAWSAHTKEGEATSTGTATGLRLPTRWRMFAKSPVKKESRHMT